MAARQALLRRSFRFAALLGGLAVGLVPCGCLHLGGGTTYVQEDKAASSRMAGLERRMEVLESAIIRTASAELPAPANSTRISDDPTVPYPEPLPSYPSP
jgi:hypothetical protein